MGQMLNLPDIFFKIPRQFPDLKKILFFPDLSLTRGNPDFHDLYFAALVRVFGMEVTMCTNVPVSGKD